MDIKDSSCSNCSFSQVFYSLEYVIELFFGFLFVSGLGFFVLVWFYGAFFVGFVCLGGLFVLFVLVCCCFGFLFVWFGVFCLFKQLS